MPEAQLALARPILHHRTPEFKELFLETRRNLQQIFRTSSEVLILASSGTGAMEAAVCNLLSPKDPALVVVAGKFGERWVEICKAHGIPCAMLEKEYGQAASPEEIGQALSRQERPRALLIQGCETSTATSHDLKGIASLVRAQFPDLLIIVDAITALGTQPVETDAWDLDVVICGSQKSFSIPPGLAMLSLSPRALQKLKANEASHRYYLDLRKELKGQPSGSSAFTPAVSLLAALHEATRQILDQGLEQVISEAQQMARCTRSGLQALGFQLLSSSPAGAVTAAFPPRGVSAGDLSARLFERFGIKVAGGQGELKGKIIRIAHLGYFDLMDVFLVLSALELCLRELGLAIETGAGVRAALSEAESRSLAPAGR